MVLRLRAPRIASSAAGPVTVTPGLGALLATGAAPTVSAGVRVSPGLGQVTLAGAAPAVAAGAAVAPGAGALLAAGLAPAVAAGVRAAPGLASIVLAGAAPGVAAGAHVAPGPGALRFTGLPPVVAAGNLVVAPGAGAIAGMGLAPSIAAGVRLLPGLGRILLAGAAPAVAAGAVITVPAGLLILAGLAPAIAIGRAEIPVRTAILDAIVTALAAAHLTVRTRPVTVERSRTDLVEEAERPFLVVVGGDMEAIGADNLMQLYRMRVILAGYLAAGSEADAEGDAAELHASVVRALIRPDPTALPAGLLLADGVTEIWLSEGNLRIEPASVQQSENPAATCLVELLAEVRQPWGNLYIPA